MTILQIANKAINPPDGGSIAILSLTQGYLANNNKVHLLNIVTHKHKNEPLPYGLKNNSNFEITGVNVNTKVNKLALLLNFLFSRKAYIAQRFISKEFQKALLDILNNEKIDVIQFEGLYSLQYVKIINPEFKGKIVYRPHNVEYVIWNRNALESKSIFKRIYFANIGKRLKHLEKSLLNKYDYIIPISSNDENSFEKLGNTKPCLVIPFGVNIKKLTQNFTSKSKSRSLCYIGALDWIPNQNGILWFINKVLPTIQNKIPEIKLHIAGRNAPKWFVDQIKHKNIIYYGQVDDAYEFISNNGPMIVPLFAGSGMRVKIIEGMALRKAIIATKQAAEGISFTHKKNIIIANDEISFAENAINLIENTEFQDEIGNNAFQLISDKYDNAKLLSNLINFIN